MNIGKAWAIFNNINGAEYTDFEKAVAIETVMDMATHNSITKEKMIEVIKWLWHNAFKWADEEEENNGK